MMKIVLLYLLRDLNLQNSITLIINYLATDYLSTLFEATGTVLQLTMSLTPNLKYFVNLCEALVRVHLEYASCVWFSCIDKEYIEKVQIHAMNIVDKLKHLPYEN